MTQSEPAPAQTDLPASLKCLPFATPEEVGLSSAVLRTIDEFYQGKVDQGNLRGIVYGIMRHGQLAHVGTIGHADLEAGTLMSRDTVFRLMSMTKPITAVALMILFEQKHFQLADPVSKFLPEFGDMFVLTREESSPGESVTAQREISIEDVLRHTAGLGLGVTGIGGTAEQMLARAVIYTPGETLADEMTKVANIPLCAQPGTIWRYSLSPDLQARLVEVISGQSFGHFLREHIFEPLGMHDTAFEPRSDMVRRLAHVYWMKDGSLSRWDVSNLPPMFPGFVWPEALARLTDASVAFERGAFGLYSTLDDYLRFTQMLANGGSFGGTRILAPDTVKLMTTDHLGLIPMTWDIKGLGFGLGFAVITDPTATGFAGTAGTFFWDGATGTVFWVDPERGLAVVALTQHLMAPAADPHALAAELHNLIYSALLT